MAYSRFKCHAEFLDKKLNGKIDVMLGSDSITLLDARLSRENKIKLIINRARMLNENLHKGIVGYNLYAGERLVTTGIIN